MASKAMISSSLLLIFLCTHFLGASSQSCVAPDNNQVYTAYETQTTPLRVTSAIKNQHIIVPASLQLTSSCPGTFSANAACFVTASVDATTRQITFRPHPTNFTEYLDTFRRPNLDVDYKFQCRETATTEPYDVSGRITFTITDTNNRDPVFSIQNRKFAINLETWQSQIPINFLTDIKVSDQDYGLSNSLVTLRASSKPTEDIILIRTKDITGGGSTIRTFSYDFYVNPETATPGNYSIKLTATDWGSRGTTTTVVLFISDGAQYQATVLIFLLVALTTWINLK